jgi:hypothetical protein
MTINKTFAEDKKGTILMADLCIQTKQCQHQGGGRC